MQDKYKLAIVAVALIASFSVGRYTVPEQSKEQLETEKLSEQEQKKDTRTTTTVTNTTKPDGEKTTTSQTVTDVILDNTKTNDDLKSDTKEETKASSHLSVSALTGAPLSSSSPYLGAPVYGLHVHKDFLGPVNVGAFVLSPNIVGVSVGLTF